MTATVRFDGTDGALLAAVVILIAGSAVLALAETSLTRTTRARARALVEAHRRGARTLERLVDDPEGFLAPVLLLVLLCQLVAATLVGVVAAHLFGAWGVAAATVFEVIVIFVFGEAVPKQWAVSHSDRAALLAAPIVAAVVGFPPVRWISRILIGIARTITPGGRQGPSPEATQSELLAFADVALEEEAIETDERTLIHQIIEFGDTIVREVMVPRPDVVAVEAESPVEDVLERAIRAGYSRIPVYRESIDDVVGIAYTKDLVRSLQAGEACREAGEIAREAHYVPETKRVAPLLREMQRGQYHLAVVIDEYGGTAGIVTLEDLIEELVGEIVDEFDTHEPLIEQVSDGVFRVSGKTPVEDVNEQLGIDLPLDDDWDTIGGLVLSEAGHVPAAGETVSIGSYLVTVDRVIGRRIGAVRLERREGEQLRFEPDVAEQQTTPATRLP